MKTGSERRYNHDGYAGCVSRRRARQTGRLVGVFQAAQAGIEDDPETPWATVCEEHGGCSCFTTLAEARSMASDPVGWCEACAAIKREDWEALARWAATGSYDADGKFVYPTGAEAIEAARIPDPAS